MQKKRIRRGPWSKKSEFLSTKTPDPSGRSGPKRTRHFSQENSFLVDASLSLLFELPLESSWFVPFRSLYLVHSSLTRPPMLQLSLVSHLAPVPCGVSHLCVSFFLKTCLLPAARGGCFAAFFSNGLHVRACLCVCACICVHKNCLSRRKSRTHKILHPFFKNDYLQCEPFSPE